MDYSPKAAEMFKKMKRLDFDSPLCKYTGFWQVNELDEIVSYGTTAFFEINFTGKTLLLDADVKGDVMFIVDGKEFAPVYDNLFVFSLDGASHSLKIRIYNDSHIAIRKLFIDGDGEFSRSPDRRYVHFIGDSITNCQPGFTLTLAEKTGWDHSNVSQGGMSLCDRFGWYTPPKWTDRRIGMETRYFQLEGVFDSARSTPYEFTYCRMPDDIVVFLGANDYLSTPEHRKSGNGEIFFCCYCRFLKKLRSHYPTSRIFIMKRLFDRGFCNAEIDRVFKNAGRSDKNLFLLNSDDWNIELLSDNVHPTALGYRQLADRLIEALN